MKNRTRKLFAELMAVAMTVTLIPGTASAEIIGMIDGRKETEAQSEPAQETELVELQAVARVLTATADAEGVRVENAEGEAAADITLKDHLYYVPKEAAAEGTCAADAVIEVTHFSLEAAADGTIILKAYAGEEELNAEKGFLLIIREDEAETGAPENGEPATEEGAKAGSETGEVETGAPENGNPATGEGAEAGNETGEAETKAPENGKPTTEAEEPATEEGTKAGTEAETEAGEPATEAETEAGEAETEAVTGGGTEAESEAGGAETEEGTEEESESGTEPEEYLNELIFENEEVLITVTAADEAQLPMDTELAAEKLAEDSEAYIEAKAAADAQSGSDPATTSYVFYSVKLLAGGEVLHPEDGMLTMQIEFKNISEDENTSEDIVRIEDTAEGKVAENVASATEGSTLSSVDFEL